MIEALTCRARCDAETGRYGRYPLGRGDWWELGGCFNGVIAGEAHPAAATAGRWFESIGWRPIPSETRTILGASADVGYDVLVATAFDRFSDHVAAGVAYHF